MLRKIYKTFFTVKWKACHEFFRDDKFVKFVSQLLRGNKIQIQRTEIKNVVQIHTGRHQDGERGRHAHTGRAGVAPFIPNVWTRRGQPHIQPTLVPATTEEAAEWAILTQYSTTSWFVTPLFLQQVQCQSHLSECCHLVVLHCIICLMLKSFFCLGAQLTSTQLFLWPQNKPDHRHNGNHGNNSLTHMQ